MPFVPLLADEKCRVHRLSALHLCRYLRAAAGKDSPLAPKKTRSLVDYLYKVLEAYAFNVYPPLKTSADWTLPVYLFPIPTPPFARDLFPADGLVIRQTKTDPRSWPCAPFSVLDRHDRALALVALNATLAQVCAVLDFATYPALLAARDRTAVVSTLGIPLSTEAEVIQAVNLVCWAAVDAEIAPDRSTLALWQHLAHSPCLAVRFHALTVLERYGQPLPLLTVEEAVDWIVQEEHIPEPLRCFGRRGEYHPSVSDRARRWEGLCEQVARLMYGHDKVLRQPSLSDGTRPDLLIADDKLQRDERGRIIHASLIIDAKTGESSNVSKYKPFASRVKAWHLRDAETLAREVRRRGDEALAQQLLEFSRFHLGPQLYRLVALREELLRR